MQQGCKKIALRERCGATFSCTTCIKVMTAQSTGQHRAQLVLMTTPTNILSSSRRTSLLTPRDAVRQSQQAMRGAQVYSSTSRRRCVVSIEA